MTDSDPMPNESNGNGPMIIMVVAGILLCAGSIGGVGFYVWRAARVVGERAEVELARAEEARQAAMQPAAAGPDQQLTRVARAMAEGLNDPVRLSDSYTPAGKPLLSWRVHLLPRLGETELYKKFRLDEPWDSPTNSKLMVAIPAFYDPPVPRKGWGLGWTYIRGFSHEGAIFEARAGYLLREIPAGAENTLAIVDAGEPITWTKPDELLWKPGGSRPKLGGTGPTDDSFLGATADGHVYRIKRAIADDTLRQLLDRRHDTRVIRLPPDSLLID
jgi:hypothetical protein